MEFERNLFGVKVKYGEVDQNLPMDRSALPGYCPHFWAYVEAVPIYAYAYGDTPLKAVHNAIAEYRRKAGPPTDDAGDRLSEIAARLGAATQGPWYWAEDEDDLVFMSTTYVSNEAGCDPETVICITEDNCANVKYVGKPLEDARFIANAPTDIAYLLELVTSQREQLAAAEAKRDLACASQAQILGWLKDQSKIRAGITRAERAEFHAIQEASFEKIDELKDERDALSAQLAAVEAERDARTAEVDGWMSNSIALLAERDALAAQVAEKRTIIEHHLNSINVLNSENKALAAKLAAARAVVIAYDELHSISEWFPNDFQALEEAKAALAALDGESDD